MAVAAADVSYKKSVTVTDTVTNGGRKGQVVVVSGARHSLFPRVTKSERVNGITRYRKEFWCNENANDDVAYGVLQWLEIPSNAGDNFSFLKGTQTDTQSALTSPASGVVPLWMGCGNLNTGLSGGESSVVLNMETPDFVFPNGGYLHISNKIKTAQTVNSDVSPGDSVNFGGVSWSKITSTVNVDYPNGLFLGNNSVLTVESTTKEEWLTIAENLTSDEVIGTGDGANVSPSLSTLTNKTKGICQVVGKTPVLTTLNDSEVTMTVTLNSDGSIKSGSAASAGKLDMATGIWTTPVTWTSAPKNGESILISYRENSYSYSGNIVTVELDDIVANAYATANSTGGACIYVSEVTGTYDSLVKTSAAGVYDDTTYPLVIHNDGVEEDTITLTFTSASAFSITGANQGSLGTGFSVSTDASPVNAKGKALFTLNHLGWGGTWVAGNTITFNIHPGAVPVWLREVVPTNTAAEPYNILVLGWYCE